MSLDSARAKAVIHPDRDQILADFYKSRDNNEFADLVFIVYGKEIRCHRSFIFINTPYFFNHYRKEWKKGKIDLYKEFEEMSATLFASIVDFCYGRRLDLSTLSFDQRCELAVIVRRFEFTGLDELEQVIFDVETKTIVNEIFVESVEEAYYQIFAVSCDYKLIRLQEIAAKALFATFEIDKVRELLFKDEFNCLPQLLEIGQKFVEGEKVVRFGLEWRQRNSNLNFEPIRKSMDLESVTSFDLIGELAKDTVFPRDRVLKAFERYLNSQRTNDAMDSQNSDANLF